ncbi:MAG TPA: protease inhibitor I9 family protein, partial [Solirubrobacteraceae bacterium]
MARATHASGPFARGAHRGGLSVSKATALSRNTSSRVIVIMRNQFNAIPASKRRTATRIRAERVGDARVLTQVRSAGGHVYRTYHALNAFAATVSNSERAALRSDSAVQQIVPDTVVQLPAPINARSFASTKAPRAAGTTPSGQTICPADPSKPLLEPEALQTTNTAFDDPSTPQAANLADGSGVKVATFADGLDPNNPDLIRPNGQHVIADYQDFSGDGLNAPTPAAEAFGDVSSVAAQGTQTYDISQFMNPAHPLPAGCNIKVRGIAPGATLDVMKVFG